MKKKRIIPILLLKNGWLVQSKFFKEYQNLGNPITAVKRLSEWASDEMIYLDISKNEHYDLKRDDQRYPNRNNFIEIIKDISKLTFMPITVGGKISSLQDINTRLINGADKICINTIAIENNNFVKQASKEFGSQCIVLSIDVELIDKKYYVYSHKYKKILDLDPLEYAKKMQDLGAGEILLNCIYNDGKGKGYDIDILKKFCSELAIPIIAAGGVGDWSHFSDALENTNVDAVAAANIFHYKDQSVYLAKKYIFEKGLNVRRPTIIKIN